MNASSSTTHELTFRESNDIVGVLSRHWTQQAARQHARKANSARELPIVIYRAVRAGRWRWHVVAYQNFARLS